MTKTILLLNNNPFTVKMFQLFIEANCKEINHVFVFPFQTGKNSTFKQWLFFFNLYGFFGSFVKATKLFRQKFVEKKFKSIFDLLEQKNIQYTIATSPSEKCVIDYIQNAHPDVVFCALPQIVPNEILNAPKIGTFNKHSSLLPSYRGVYPVFWQMLNHEKLLGISVHKMEEKIDKGHIVFQKSFDRDMNASFDENYDFIIEQTSDVLNQAYQLIKKEHFKPIIPTSKGSYYGFPSQKDIARFKRMRLKII